MIIDLLMTYNESQEVISMKVAAISELKAKLARYIRLVKSGEDIEIHDRGVPVARLVPLSKASVLAITPPRRSPASLAKYRFSVRPKARFDVVEALLEDRARR